MTLEAEQLLLNGVADESCRAVVVLPARNEETSLTTTLDALARQVDVKGKPLSMRSFEVLLLLNNCTDNSATVARRWQREHPGVLLYCFERELDAGAAHIGTVRRLLMNTAWSRLQGGRGSCAILSTDADSSVAKDWIVQNLQAVTQGADAVGGVVELLREDFDALSEPVQAAYTSDRRYQDLMAEMEDLYDPQKGDAWPRHLEHYGASLACTPEVYLRAGGMPAVAELEDVAFVDRMRRVDATIRHEPKVVVSTSGRLRGRVATGLSGQLRLWQRMHDEGQPHCVLTSAWLKHRFRTLRSLRRFFCSGDKEELPRWLNVQQEEIRHAQRRCGGTGEFLHRVDCDRLVEETFAGKRTGTIHVVNASIAALLAAERRSRAMNKTATPDLILSGSAFEDVDAVSLSSNES